MRPIISQYPVGSLEYTMERALRPGKFVDYGAGWSFVEGLEVVAAQIEALVTQDAAARAVALYELFLAGCYAKAEELDDSSGGFGMFVARLFCRWAQAREVAHADPHDTAVRLLTWMDDDPYGFCTHLDQEVVRILSPGGLAALAEAVRTRCSTPPSQAGLAADTPEHWYQQRQWQALLKAIYATQHDIAAYVDVCTSSELTPADCDVIARLHQERQAHDEALVWVERGLQLDSGRYSGTNIDLRRRKHALLVGLGRAADALAFAWQEYQSGPSTFTYATLMESVSEDERTNWHSKAMEAIAQAALYTVIPLWLETSEIDRLVARLRQAEDQELESLGHTTTEPAAQRLANSHPDVAARIYRALGLRILAAKKSKYYDDAVSHFAQAKHCYEQSGLLKEWLSLVTGVRRAHGRKYSFMPSFERVVANQPPPPRMSFLERAQQQWQRRQS